MTPLARLIRYVRTEGMGRALRHRDFSLFACASWLSAIGMWMQRIGIGWLTWELTHSGAWLGLMAAAQALPAVFLLPFTGAVADRIDRLRLMRLTQTLSIALNALLAALTLGGWITVELMLAITLAIGIVLTFNMPARMTMAPSLVPRADLSAAIAVNSFMFTSSTFIGPAIGGFLIDHGGVGLTFLGNTLSYIPFLVVLFVITLRDRENRRTSESGILADVIDGMRYTSRHPGIGPILILSLLLSILVRPLTDLVPGFVDDIFHAGPGALGMVMSSFGLGGMVGSLWMANRGRTEGTARIFFATSLIATAATLGFAALDTLIPAFVLMAAIGFTQAASGNAAQSLIQGSVEQSHRARVISLYSLTHRAAPPLRAMAMGAASHAIGLQMPVAISAALAFLVVLWFARQRAAIAAATETVPAE